MDANQQQQQQHESILRAIAVSSMHLPTFSAQDRQSAFAIIEEFKSYDGRIALCISWLQQEHDHYYMEHNVTTATKLLALETITAFLQKNYSSISEPDRLALRQGVLKAAQLLAGQTPATITEGGGGSGTMTGLRLLAKKLAAVLEGMVIRDFPQRWTTFATDVFAPTKQSGGLWYDEPGTYEAVHHLGVKICLECLKLVAEDCTDSDFNSKVSTKRRNDVLIGLNEVSGSFLPLFFQLLEHYTLLQQSKTNLHNMYSYLVNNNKTISNLTADENAMYQKEVQMRQGTSVLIADALVTLEKFCCSMPVAWMISSSDNSNTNNNSTANNSNNRDFVNAMLHLLREPDANIQIKAVECLEQLTLRNKLDFKQWMRLITDLPHAIQEASQQFQQDQEQSKIEMAAKGITSPSPDPLSLQFDFHRALSRMLAQIVSSNISHMTSSKELLSGTGPNFEKLNAFFRLLVDLLHHPSGRICSEQLNTWVQLLRDPQITKVQLLQPFMQEILSCYIDRMKRIRWEDVENQTHPQTLLMEASFDDQEEYDLWMADFRSRASLLFKFGGNTAPQIASSVINSKIKLLLTTYGNGEPLNFLEPSNNQLTPKSDAVMQFESICQPLDNILGGIPPWAVDDNSKPPKDQDGRDVPGIRASVKASLTELAQALVTWNPSYVWLKFRRATLLDALKHYWKHNSATLLQGIDSLIRYIGLPDEWNVKTAVGGADGNKMSVEIVGLKKKSGVALVSISKRVPHHLVPWLSQLSDATRSLLSSQGEGLIPLNQMHLYEFLSCVAAAVEDPVARSNFIANVLSDAVETLESPEVQQSISSASALLSSFGITQTIDRPDLLTDPTNVRNVTSSYNRLFSALNRLLSVGKRCNEAARKRIIANGIQVAGLSNSGVNPSTTESFPDEGPLSIRDLAINDPFAPLWPRILPSWLTLYEAILTIWRPDHQSLLLQNQYQRYAYAISDDEAYTSKTHNSHSGGVFGEGGTAGSVVAGTHRRDTNLVPKWSGWFNELRNTCFQMFGLLATGRVLFAPEIADMYPRLVAVLVDPVNLKSMEHRHFTQFLKHVIELLLVSCPAPLYPTHLEPILSPVIEHMRFRLEKTWLPVISSSPHADATKALSSADCNSAAALASRGGDEWFSWYYAHTGLFVGDLDSVTSEAAVERYRVEISRTFSDLLQTALALKGEWALVLANQAKEEQAAKRNDATKLVIGPRNLINNDGVQLNANGTPRSAHQASIDARKLLRIHGLCHFLLLENERIAGNLTLVVVQCLGYPDAYTCRRMAKVCHRILETVAWSPQYTQLLGQQLFTQTVKNIVTEPKWMVGIEWDMINVIRDIYCRLVLGQTMQPGGQGAGLQQPSVLQNPNQFEQAKTVDRPLQGGGILVVASDLPRQILASLPGIGVAAVERLEQQMKSKRSAKDQKDVIRDLLRDAADQLKETNPSSSVNSGGAAASIFDRAVEEESLLHMYSRKNVVPDIGGGKLVTRSQAEKAARKQNEQEPEGMASAIFG